MARDKRAARNVGLGIAFRQVEITFIYSFFCLIDSFDRVAEAVKGLADIPSTQRETSPTEVLWQLHTHPERRGLTPVFDFVHRCAAGNGAAHAEEITCEVRIREPFEVCSGLQEHDFSGPADPNAIRIVMDEALAIIRLGRNGMGSVSIKFRLDTTDDALRKTFPDAVKERQAAMLDHLGPLPFIFSLLTLARAEDNVIKDAPVPQSRIRLASPSRHAHEFGAFTSLHTFFGYLLFNVFYKNIRDALGAEAPQIASIDRLLLDPPDGKEYQAYWQSPYVVTCIDVDERATKLADQFGAAAHTWWFQSYDNKLFQTNGGLRRSEDGKQIEIWRCYKEAILLLLRLYQWRTILAVDEFLASYARDAQRTGKIDYSSYETPHWRRILVLPDLLQHSHFGYLFRDADLVWDTRYLMLYHERSTLVLNCVPPATGTARRSDFRALFTQSLLRTLEGVRCQLHAGLAVNLYLDQIVDELAKAPENTRDTSLLKQMQRLYASYAKIVRDPNAMSTDAAALNVVRRRAHRTYEIDSRYRLLRTKFEALELLFGGQSLIQNIKAFQDLEAEARGGDE